MSPRASFFLGALIIGLPCLIAGVMYGDLAPYHNVTVEESLVANKILAADLEFSKLYLQHASTREVGFAGKVLTNEAYSKLESAVKDQFGRIKLEMRMRCVEVAAQQEGKP